MNIALSFPHKTMTMTGVRNLAQATIDETLKLDQTNRYFFLEENYVTEEEITQLNYFKKNSLEYSSRSSDMLCYANDIKILHSYWDVFTEMKYPCRRVFTIYDLIPLMYPEWHYEMKEYFDTSVRKSAALADAIIAISKQTKEDIVYYYGINPDKVHVIYPGIKERKENKKEQEGLRIKYAFEYFLSVCTIEPRKNLQGIINGYVEFCDTNKDSGIKLVLAGGMGWDQDLNTLLKSAGKYEKDIIVTGYVDDSELAYLYRNTKAVVFAPFYEGFGLPVLEALHYGKAVICSDTSSLPEVGGNAVLYCNPYEPSSIAYAMQVVSTNDVLVKSIVKQAVGQAEKFSYKQAALKTIELYKMLE